jgi:hypothetical protein
MRRGSRLQIRMLLVAVAVAAPGAEGAVLLRRREHYRRLAAYHASRILPDYPGFWDLSRSFWHERMRQRYEHAARSPWLRVDPDPPGPFAEPTDRWRPPSAAPTSLPPEETSPFDPDGDGQNPDTGPSP